MDRLFDVADLGERLEALTRWLREEVFVLGTLGQLVVVLFALLLALYLRPRLQPWFQAKADASRAEHQVRRIAQAAVPLTFPILWLALQWASQLVVEAAHWPHQLITTTVSLVSAWVVIRFSSSFVRDPVWAKFIAVTVWAAAALNIVDLLDATIRLLDDLALTVGDLRLSALTVIKGVLSLAVLLWGATVLSQFLERRITALPSLTPSVQVLFSKLLKVVLITLAIVAALTSVGIDLTAFALFSGAIGVGIGFGLQKVVSNLISGVILLLDKSIKPGDVIAVEDTYGWIRTLGARYASVVTRDGTEFLIPNEDLITQRVINWSFTDRAVRLRLPVGVSYRCDLRRAMALCLEAAAEVPRVKERPPPTCLVRGFGDSAVDLELRIWIDDPQNGVSNVKSETYLLIWDKFHEHGIEIPFPQRDLHVKSVDDSVAGMIRAAG